MRPVLLLRLALPSTLPVRFIWKHSYACWPLSVALQTRRRMARKKRGSTSIGVEERRGICRCYLCTRVVSHSYLKSLVPCQP